MTRKYSYRWIDDDDRDSGAGEKPASIVVGRTIGDKAVEGGESLTLQFHSTNREPWWNRAVEKAASILTDLLNEVEMLETSGIRIGQSYTTRQWSPDPGKIYDAGNAPSPETFQEPVGVMEFDHMKARKWNVTVEDILVGDNVWVLLSMPAREDRRLLARLDDFAAVVV